MSSNNNNQRSQRAEAVPALSEEQAKRMLEAMIGTDSGILSDFEIEQLCVLPPSFFDEASYNADLQKFRQNNPNLNLWPMPAYALEAVQTESERLKLVHTHVVGEEIKKLFKPMIENFASTSVREGANGAKVLSYGLGSYGYDVRLSSEVIDGKQPYVIFTNHRSALIDPKRGDAERNTTPLEIHVDDDGAKYVIMPAHTYGMGFTIEKFNIPRDVSVICVGKSTYARSSVFVNVTPIEAGFEGTVVIELGNSTGSPVKIYLDEGVAQFIFFRGSRACKTSYADRKGKYMGQRGVVHAKV